ncbi:alpha/beta hydrolase family protein [Anaerosporobacter sp.]
MKKIMKIFVIIILIIIALIVCLVIYASKKSVVFKNYNEKQITGGKIEAKYSKMGSYEYESKVYDAGKENNKQSHYKVWYPITEGKYPLVVMVNGTGVPYQKYEAIFEHLASWGFIVIGTDYETSWDGVAASNMLDFALSNDEIKSMVDGENIAIGGHSQGGEGTFNAITEFENRDKYKCAFALSPTSNPLAIALKWSHNTGKENEYGYDLTKVNIPIFMVAGDGKWDSETISPISEMKKTFETIPSDISVVMARLKNTDHSDVLWKSDGYVTAWLMYYLKNDSEASNAFYGGDAELLVNKNWQDFKCK